MPQLPISKGMSIEMARNRYSQSKRGFFSSSFLVGTIKNISVYIVPLTVFTSSTYRHNLAHCFALI